MIGIIHNGQLIAQAAAYLPANDTSNDLVDFPAMVPNGRICVIQSCLVVPDFRKQGCQSILVEWRRQIAIENQRPLLIAEIAVANLDSKKNCEKIGMIPVHYGFDSVDNCELVYLAGFSNNKTVASKEALWKAFKYAGQIK
ncbi:hypothetical protein FACS189421_12210 [Bacteroidia bacterium]|nr:hypothetical protein FACS189421_12210 [Bacteroidia bacterium]